MEYESRLKRFDKLMERAHKEVGKCPEHAEIRDNLERLNQERDRISKWIDELRLKPLENWREEEIEKAVPMGIWDALPSNWRNWSNMLNINSFDENYMLVSALILACLMTAAPAQASGLYVASGYDFRQEGFDVLAGYRFDSVALELAAVNGGIEPLDAKPDRVYNLDGLFFYPATPRISLFAKAGGSFPQADYGASAHRGYNYGVGFDFKLIGNLAVTGYVTHYKVADDAGDTVEVENLITLGLKYQF